MTVEKKYSKIQFVGLAISATPGNLVSVEEMSDDGEYLGFENEKEDMSKRLALVKTTIENSYRLIDSNSDTLKVFILPEFFFRGVKGAYYKDSDLFFNTYFKDFINDFLSQEIHSDWIFILGTLLTSTDKINADKMPTSELFPVGDNLLDVYYRLHPKGNQLNKHYNSLTEVRNSSIKSILRNIDDIETNEMLDENSMFSDNLPKLANFGINHNDKAYVSILKSTLNYCDLTAVINIINRCFIVQGGTKSPRIIKILKKHKSKEDFILNAIEDNYIQSIVRYPTIDDKSEIKQSDNDDYSIFKYGGITFGGRVKNFV